MINGMDSLSYSQNEYQYIHDYVAGATCYPKVAAAMIQALRALEVIHRAGAVVDGEEYALDFSSEILKLKAALRVLGVDDEGGSETKLDA